MAYGLSEITQNGVDYRINDPNIANEFSASTAYSSGTYVNYNGILYRFTTDHPAGAWNASHVSAVEVGDEIANLKNAFEIETKNIVSDYDSNMWEKGGLLNGQNDSYRQACRIRTKQFYTFQRGINLKALSVKTRLSGYIDGETVPWTNSITVEPNKNVRLLIDGAWGNTSPSVMSISDLLETVKITAPILPVNTMLTTTKAIATGNYGEYMFEKGSINTDGTDDSYRAASRVRFIDFYTLPMGMEVRANNAVTKIEAVVDDNGVISTEGWQTRVIIQPMQKVRLCIESDWGNTSPTQRSLDDVLASVQISTVLSSLSELEENMANSLTEIGKTVNMLNTTTKAIVTGNYDEYMFEKGSMNTDGTDDSYRAASRIRFKEFYTLPMGMEVSANNAVTKIEVVVDDNGVISTEGWQTRVVIRPMQKVRLCIESDWGNTSPTQRSLDDVLASVTIATFTQSLALGIPDYYFENNYLPSKIDDILSKSPEDGFMFVFITDFHVSDNRKQSPKLIRYIKEQTNSVPFVIFGGDVLITTVAEGIDVMEDAKDWQSILSYIGKDSVYQTQGNHDYLGYYYVDGERVIYNAPWNVCRQLIMGNLTDVVWCPGKIAYYFDVAIANTRIIVCNDYDTDYNKPDFIGNVAFSIQQLEWIVNVALSDDTKRVIFVSHQTYDTNMGGEYAEHQDRFVNVQSLFKAIVNKTNYSYGSITKDFTNSGIVFVAHFAGHRHSDEHNIDDGVLTICTTCDAIYDTTNRIPGTVTEQAFDIVAIDYSTRTIKTTRIGYGDNRSFSF